MDFSTQDLRDWEKDVRGSVFWEAIKDRYSFAISQLRKEVRKGNLNEAIYHASQADSAEETLQLVSALIQEQVQDKETHV